MTPIVEIAREAIALAEKATPGPWSVDTWIVRATPKCNDIHVTGVRHGDRGVATSVAHPHGGMKEYLENAALIAHAGTHYRAVCAELLRIHQAADVNKLTEIICGTEYDNDVRTTVRAALRHIGLEREGKL